MTAVLPGRLPPEACFPAGRPEYRVTRLALPSGLRLRAIEAGPADGPVVLFLHGWACSVYGFRHNLPSIAAAGYRAVAIDLPGHGQSDKPVTAGAYTRDRMRDAVLAAIDALGIDRLALVGHSMGGAIATRIAIELPERVTHMALLAPAGLTTPRMLRLALAGSPDLLAAFVAHLMPRQLIRLILHLTYGRIAHWEERDIDEYWSPTRDPAFARALRSLLHEFDWEPATPAELAGLADPTLIMFGTRDRLFDRVSARRLVDGLPRVAWREVVGAGHMIPEEAPARVNESILEMLRLEGSVRRA